MTKQHKGWHSRGFLPHFDAPDLIQGITFRLCDSLPQEVIEMMAYSAGKKQDSDLRRHREKHLNKGYGACYLRQPPVARLTQDALLHFDGVRYRLLAWVIMPNHVHVIAQMREGFPLDSVVHSWKSFTANRVNRLLQRDGPFWYPDYFDRYIRNERHLRNAINYVHLNPVHAGLVPGPEDWEFSSARYAI